MSSLCTPIAFHTSFVLTTILTEGTIIKSSVTNEETKAQRDWATYPRQQTYSDLDLLISEPDLLPTVPSYCSQQGVDS